ncbi:hypothetical protein [Paraburkholderia acidisoli]|uniref:Uncharacterized protein n=1 Tax=Paraburkholderia acidisoli TaxID=2571748 RepID=A0A7Z2JH17_9BURK|nr:hypothetical protein [Paraburkholderia acidisoli]QGZ65242.1 hypothetical protein FAZ98_26075 [Paraburkholderia acidisoli]
MNKATLIVATAALTLSAGAYAQSNNTLATPSVTSPAAAATTTSGYGTPAAANSESGTGSPNPALTNGVNTAPTAAYGTNNTLATPSTKAPSGQ